MSAYAEGCRRWAVSGDTSGLAVLWRSIPFLARDRLLDACGTLGSFDGEAQWRAKVVAYVEAHYA